MLKVTLLVVMLTALAQIFPSCGGEEGAGVTGWVEAKKVETGTGTHAFILIINSTDYEVPGYFWHQVAIGDLVKWDGKTWTIVKKANEPTSLRQTVPGP